MSQGTGKKRNAPPGVAHMVAVTTAETPVAPAATFLRGKINKQVSHLFKIPNQTTAELSRCMMGDTKGQSRLESMT